LNWLYIFQADPSNSYEIEFNVLSISYLMRRNFRRSRNCCRTWNILVVVFLNCSCENNFRAPSRYRKGCMIRKKIFHSNSFYFLTQQKIKKVNKQSSSTKISRFDENFYASNMRWRAHKNKLFEVTQPLLIII